MTDGLDYSYGRPGGAALAKAGARFAARYLSHSEGKNLTRAEADDLAAHGVSCVVVWETTAQRAGAGRAAGIADAKAAAQQAAACGMPKSRPIYFAVDYDASPSAVAAYFGGVVSVLGLARTGVYGGYRVVDYLLDHKLASWAWQTVAWSGGRWDARAHIRQYASTVTIAGVSCDKDTAMAADYGQWTPGHPPATEPTSVVPAAHTTTVREDDMPPTLLTESSDKDTPVPAGEWTTIAMAADTALLQGPCTYQLTAYVTVKGTPGTRITGRFYDLPLATKRHSSDLPVDLGVIGADGILNAALSRPGALDKNEQLKVELFAASPATVAYRVLRALTWRP
ncbi:glycoside hydrolase domain-containing protein [Streptomyces sp. NPDC020983]|uniref:glycoside hydrolase domain-containing protein n=1 Tax=Streptomyces sp. NPDC020983 TaxID=3365106 RepID=UPI0037B7AD48